MNIQPSFINGALFAFMASVLGTLVFMITSGLVAGDILLRLLICGLALSYLLYLILGSKQKTGLITVLTSWSILMTLNLLLTDSFMLYVSLHILFIWLVRSLYFYNSLFSSLADLLLAALSLGFAVLAWQSSHSLLLSLWCFFLTQALFVFIPTQLTEYSGTKTGLETGNEDFEQAYKNAQMALHKLNLPK